MSFLVMVAERFREMSSLARKVFDITLIITFALYISGITLFFITPYVGDYLWAMSILRGIVEAAPATFASGVSSAIICDIVLHRRR